MMASGRKVDECVEILRDMRDVISNASRSDVSVRRILVCMLLVYFTKT